MAHASPRCDRCGAIGRIRGSNSCFTGGCPGISNQNVRYCPGLADEDDRAAVDRAQREGWCCWLTASHLEFASPSSRRQRPRGRDRG